MGIYRVWTIAVLGVFSLTACGGIYRTAGPADPQKRHPVMVQETRSQGELPASSVADAADGSLWSENRHRGLFNDLRARQVGDLVTVNIVETSKASKKATTKTGRESSIDAGISNLLGYENKHSKISETMLKASMKNDFNGSGETSRDETMTASVTVRVLEVMPNGNLVIKGAREIQVNNENQVITLTGIIRPEDISPDNTVLSSYIADARITYSGRGPITDKQRPGWLARLVDSVWPF